MQVLLIFLAAFAATALVPQPRFRSLQLEAQLSNGKLGWDVDYVEELVKDMMVNFITGVEEYGDGEIHGGTNFEDTESESDAKTLLKDQKRLEDFQWLVNYCTLHKSSWDQSKGSNGDIVKSRANV